MDRSQSLRPAGVAAILVLYTIDESLLENLLKSLHESLLESLFESLLGSHLERASHWKE
jgi:hypothetical protein